MAKRKSRHSQSSTKPRVPITKGFDFPLFPEVHGQQSTKPSLSRAGVKSHSSHQKSRHSRSIVPVHSHNSSIIQIKEKVSYKRKDSKNIEVVETDDEYTAASSENEEDIKNTVFRKNQKKMIVQQQIIAVEHKDAATQYYEETYSTSLYPPIMKEMETSASTSLFPPMKETDTSTAELGSRRRRRRHNFKNMGLDREDDYISTINGRPMSHRSRRHKAVQQRMIDNYLAQPKVLIVPIVRESKKPRTPRTATSSYYSSSYAAQRRRILRKPWLQQSNTIQMQKSIPMLRETGIGSSNIRFASGVKIHAFETPDSTESFSSGKMRDGSTYDQNKGSFSTGYYKNPFTHRPTTRKIKRRPRPTSGKKWRSDETRSSSRQERPDWHI